MTQTEIIFMVSESHEGGFEERAPGYPIFAQANTIEEMRMQLRDAVRCHFDEAERPKVIRLHLVRDEVIPA